MTRWIFVGPSCPGITAGPGLILRGPAKCGDLISAVEAGAQIIGLVDGLFETVPSVWHKEILWALSRGVVVIGASSMGALRAVEMQRFGMQGVGRVFSAFRTGRLEDDDEVAVIHAPAELGFSPLSDAMVNIRATLGRALKRGLIGRSTHAALTAAAKSLFYKDRTFAHMLGAVSDREIGCAGRSGLAEWLTGNAVDVKKEDAIRLLGRLKAGDRRHAPTPTFVSSRHWESFMAERNQRARSANRPVHDGPVRLVIPAKRDRLARQRKRDDRTARPRRAGG